MEPFPATPPAGPTAAIDPNPGPLLVPIIPQCFAQAAGPVGAALRAAGRPTEAGSLAYTADLVGRLFQVSEFDAAHVRRVLGVASELPALHGSQDLADLYDLVRTIEELDRPAAQRSQPPAACVVRARQQQQAAWASVGPDDLPRRSGPPA